MKTAVDKNESELDKMKRESLEWLDRYGKTAPPFISVAVNAFRSYTDTITDVDLKDIDQAKDDYYKRDKLFERK